MPSLITSTRRSQKKVTLAEAIDAWLEERQPQVKPQTFDEEKRYLEEMMISIGNRPFHFKGLELVEEIADRLQAWIDSYPKGRNPRYYQIRKEYVGRFWNYCLRKGLLRHNPCKFVKTPRVIRKTYPVFTHDEVMLLLKAARGMVMRWLILCAYRTGLDLKDVCLLRWTEVDMEELVIRVTRKKTSKSGGGQVTIPILPGSDLHESLQLLREAEQTDQWPGPGYVCHDAASIYMGLPARFPNDFKKLLNRVGIKGKSFKTLRRTFLTAITNSGAPTAMVCKMSGHSNPAMLARYVLPDVDAMRQALIKSQDFLERKSNGKIQITDQTTTDAEGHQETGSGPGTETNEDQSGIQTPPPARFNE